MSDESSTSRRVLKRALSVKLHDLPVLRLQRSDLEQILRLFREACGKVTVEVAGYVIEDVADLGNLTEEQTTRVTLRGTEPSVELSLRDFQATLWELDSDDPACRHLAADVLEVIRPGRRRFLHAVTGFWLLSVLWVVPLALSLLAVQSGSTYATKLALGVTVLLIGCWVALTMHVRFHRYAVVYLSERHMNFFQRNRDQIILLSATSILGVVVGGLIVWLLTRSPTH